MTISNNNFFNSKIY